jgi:class 3 adenylate cyclase
MDKAQFQTDVISEPQRQLAAIMFADMTGYTAMMQDNEQKAITLRNHQKNAIEKFIPAFNGKIIQYFGDGTLSIFNSAIDAVNAAIEIQNEL